MGGYKKVNSKQPQSETKRLYFRQQIVCSNEERCGRGLIIQVQLQSLV
jgi:hypothetical protein